MAAPQHIWLTLGRITVSPIQHFKFNYTRRERSGVEDIRLSQTGRLAIPD